MDGFDAMGKPVPWERKSAALGAMREMIPTITTGTAVAVIDRVSLALERDEPYEAMRQASTMLDPAGAYRLIAHLLT